MTTHKMPFISAALTMRVSFSDQYFEVRDSLAHDWCQLLLRQSIVPLLLPNHITNIDMYFEVYPFDLLILTGGDDLVYEKNYLDEKDQHKVLRDNFEIQLIDFCQKRKIPILGVCRGMQILNKVFGGYLVKMEYSHHHVGKEHEIQFCDKNSVTYLGTDRLFANSYHSNFINQGSLGNDLETIATADNSTTIESFRHKYLPIAGIMWHPERQFKIPFSQNLHQKDLMKFLQFIFKGQLCKR